MKGMLQIETDTKARKALIYILYHRDQTFSWEQWFIDNVTAAVHRMLTVSEGNKIHSIRGRMVI